MAKETTVDDLRTQVAQKITDSVPEVVDSVVSALSQEEIKARVKMVVVALREVESLDKEIGGIRADQEVYNEKGELVSSSFSKSQYKKLDGLKQRREKLANKLNNALKNNDFSGLKGRNDNQSDTKEDSEDSE